MLDTYDSMIYSLVKSVNDEDILDLHHLKTLLETNANSKQFVELKFYDQHRRMVFETESIKKLNKDIYF